MKHRLIIFLTVEIKSEGNVCYLPVRPTVSIISFQNKNTFKKVLKGGVPLLKLGKGCKAGTSSRGRSSQGCNCWDTQKLWDLQIFCCGLIEFSVWDLWVVCLCSEQPVVEMTGQCWAHGLQNCILGRKHFYSRLSSFPPSFMIQSAGVHIQNKNRQLCSSYWISTKEDIKTIKSIMIQI